MIFSYEDDLCIALPQTAGKISTYIIFLVMESGTRKPEKKWNFEKMGQKCPNFFQVVIFFRVSQVLPKSPHPILVLFPPEDPKSTPYE